MPTSTAIPSNESTDSSYWRQLTSPWIQKDVSQSDAYKRLKALLDDSIRAVRPGSAVITGPLRYSLLYQALEQLPSDIAVIRLDGLIHAHQQQNDLALTSNYVIIVLDVFERWSCNPLQQPFLYRLLNGDTKCFVIGVTELMDAVDGLEKRVKSRHSQIVIYACEDVHCQESELLSRRVTAITQFMNTQRNIIERPKRAKGRPKSVNSTIEMEQVLALVSQPTYDQDIESISRECTLNELLVLICIKRLLEKRQATSFLLSAVYEEYQLLMHSSGLLSMMPISRNAFQLVPTNTSHFAVGHGGTGTKEYHCTLEYQQHCIHFLQVAEDNSVNDGGHFRIKK